MYKLYSFFNLDKEILLNNLYDFIVSLGPFFIKIFQNLSSKKLLPLDLLELSEKSKDCVYYSTNDYNCILNEIKNTGFKIESEVPIGAGSICLVYKGIYNGQKCVIKICHNSIKQKMERSVRLLTFLINIFTFVGYSVLINNVDFEDILENINQQINLNHEAFNIKLYKKELEKYKLLNFCDVPDVYEHNNNYIIESYIDGLTYNEIVDKYQQKTFECITILRLISRFQFLYFDIQHGDLHTSNYLYKIENNKLKLYLIDFGLCINLTEENKMKRRKSDVELLSQFYLAELGIIHPFATFITYLQHQKKNIFQCLNKDKEEYPEIFNFLRKVNPNISDDFLIEYVFNNIHTFTRKQIFTIQFKNYDSFENCILEMSNMMKYLSITKFGEKIDSAITSSQNGMMKSLILITNLDKNKKYFDIDLNLNSTNVFDLFQNYYIKYVIENLQQDKYLDDIDDKIKMSYQQIIYMFQIKYKEQLNRKDIREILDQFQMEIKDYLYHFFYRNQYYTQRNIVIEKMYTLFYLKSDLLHGMIEYLQFKKPNGLRQEYYEIVISDINIKHIISKNNVLLYDNCEKGIFKGDQITKIDELDVTNYTIEECLKSIKKCEIITFKDCFSFK